MMGFVDEEQIVQAEPKEDGDYAGRQKKALWIVYRPSVSAFPYCEQPQTVCSGSAPRRVPEPSVMDRAHWGRDLCHPHLARRLLSIPAQRVLALGSQAFVTFCLDYRTVMTLWRVLQIHLPVAIRTTLNVFLVLCCLYWLPSEPTATFLVLFFILIDWAQDTTNTAEGSSCRCCSLPCLGSVITGILHWTSDGIFLVPRDNNVTNIGISKGSSSTDGPLWVFTPGIRFISSALLILSINVDLLSTCT